MGVELGSLSDVGLNFCPLVFDWLLACLDIFVWLVGWFWFCLDIFVCLVSWFWFWFFACLLVLDCFCCLCSYTYHYHCCYIIIVTFIISIMSSSSNSSGSSRCRKLWLNLVYACVHVSVERCVYTAEE